MSKTQTFPTNTEVMEAVRKGKSFDPKQAPAATQTDDEKQSKHLMTPEAHRVYRELGLGKLIPFARISAYAERQNLGQVGLDELNKLFTAVPCEITCFMRGESIAKMLEAVVIKEDGTIPNRRDSDEPIYQGQALKLKLEDGAFKGCLFCLNCLDEAQNEAKYRKPEMKDGKPVRDEEGNIVYKMVKPYRQTLAQAQADADRLNEGFKEKKQVAAGFKAKLFAHRERSEGGPKRSDPDSNRSKRKENRQRDFPPRY